MITSYSALNVMCRSLILEHYSHAYKTLLKLPEAQLNLSTSAGSTSTNTWMHNADEEIYVCLDNLKNNCLKGNSCDCHHISAPYLWQINGGKLWTNLSDNEMIETQFRKPECNEITLLGKVAYYFCCLSCCLYLFRSNKNVTSIFYFHASLIVSKI